MKKQICSLLLTVSSVAVLNALVPNTAFANDTAIISRSSSYAAQPFQFYCDPYTTSFVDGGSYDPTQSGNCFFSIPSDVAAVPNNFTVMAIYQGTPGNAVERMERISLTGATLTETMQSSFEASTSTPATDDYIFIPPAKGTDFFAVVYPAGPGSLSGGFPQTVENEEYFSSGAGTPPSVYHLIRWTWSGDELSQQKKPNPPVIIIPGILGSWQVNGQWTIDPITHAYDNLINTLEANGYVADQTLFTFPYDWEQDNVVTAHQLAQKIADVKSICGCDKVDLVGHSMGGLVAAQYIESSDYQNDVDKAIFIATPFGGSPIAYEGWEGGEIDFGQSSTNFLLGLMLSKEAYDAGYGSTFAYIQNKPLASLEELLPASPSLGYLTTSASTPFTPYPTGYPRNAFLEDLASRFSSILNSVQTFVIAGDLGAASTMSGFVVKPSNQLPLWPDGQPVTKLFGEGDNTVLLESASLMKQPDEIFNADHTSIVTASEGYVVKALTGKDATTTVQNKSTPDITSISVVIDKLAPSPEEFNALGPLWSALLKTDASASISTMLLITLYSPIDVQVTAPDGSIVGTDLSTGEAVNQIPGAIYSGPIGEHEFVMIPDPLPGTYQVNTRGTGSGAYTVATDYSTEATSSISLTAGTTTLNQVIDNTLTLSATSSMVKIAPVLPAPATTTPTTTPTTLSSDTCLTDLKAAFDKKWIGKQATYTNLVADCKALKPLFATRDSLQKAKQTILTKSLLTVCEAAINLTLADLGRLAKDKSNAKDAVSLITKYETWFKNHQQN